MRVQNAVQGQPEELVSALRRRIAECSHGRLHETWVEVAADHLIVHGQVNSQHVKQLVLQAVAEVGESIAVELDVRVRGSPGSGAGNGNDGESSPVIVPSSQFAELDAGERNHRSIGGSTC
jgi:hypothetical protein